MPLDFHSCFPYYPAAFFIRNKFYITKRLRINLRITAPTVRLIGSQGEQLGIVSIEKAKELAAKEELDLAEVAPKANPPVCKILDYGKYQYHQKKVETKHRRMQKKTEVKGVRMGFKTGEHDMQVKARQAQKFLEQGNAVKVALLFRGREAVYKDLATEKMMKFFQNIEGVGNMDQPPKKQGNALIMILTPK